jgi:hypothetical protein
VQSHPEFRRRGPALHDADEGAFGYVAPRAEGCAWMVNGFTPRGVVVRFFRPTVGAVLNLAARVQFYNGVTLTGLFGVTDGRMRCLLGGYELSTMLGVFNPRRRFSSCTALVRLDYEIVDDAYAPQTAPFHRQLLAADPALALAVAFSNGYYVAREDVRDAIRGLRSSCLYWVPEYWRVRNALAEFVPELDACRAALEVCKFEVPYLGSHPGYSRSYY